MDEFRPIVPVPGFKLPNLYVHKAQHMQPKVQTTRGVDRDQIDENWGQVERVDGSQ
jgi:hypothetical protein